MASQMWVSILIDLPSFLGSSMMDFGAEKCMGGGGGVTVSGVMWMSLEWACL